ncbi:hypothetical protein NDU88_008086 [Pleurodeles waltl]|uniref:Uncharacterized protein n=1 Tax=Pleurodeles waltl TaxID=8319 RepID=A0AAV7QNP7_PLEWA|nr:hypothetical protein NDU88_008086 [Pleurodeles waltl]
MCRALVNFADSLFSRCNHLAPLSPPFKYVRTPSLVFAPEMARQRKPNRAHCSVNGFVTRQALQCGLPDIQRDEFAEHNVRDDLLKAKQTEHL